MAQLNLSGPENSVTRAVAQAATTLSDGSYLTVTTRNRDGGGNEIVAEFFNADGSTMGKGFVVDAQANGTLGLSLSAATLTDGRIAIAWTHDTNGLGGFVGKTQIFTPDGLAATLPVVTDKANSVDISPLKNDGFALAYLDLIRVRSAIFDANGVAGNDVLHNDDGKSPSVATLQNGSFVSVTSVLPGTGGYDVMAYLRTPTGDVTPKTLKHLNQDDSATSVTALANGNFVVAWISGNNNGNSLKAQIYDASGTAVGNELTLHQDVAISITAPTLQALSNGGFAVAFQGSSN